MKGWDTAHMTSNFFSWTRTSLTAKFPGTPPFYLDFLDVPQSNNRWRYGVPSWNINVGPVEPFGLFSRQQNLYISVGSMDALETRHRNRLQDFSMLFNWTDTLGYALWLPSAFEFDISWKSDLSTSSHWHHFHGHNQRFQWSKASLDSLGPLHSIANHTSLVRILDGAD